MLAINLMGGFGNQLFQVAFVACISKESGLPFMLDWPHKRSFKHLNSSKINFLADPLGPVDVNPQFEGLDIHSEKQLGYYELPPPNPKHLTHYLGYFQSNTYYAKHRDFLRELFTPVDSIKDYLNSFPINWEETCAIHVRRGDYLALPSYHPVLSMSYYHEAMNIIQAKGYLVFSDDLPWCKEHFLGEQFRFEDELSCGLLTTFFAMSKCKHHIVANSSFSWLADFLSDGTGKSVYPKIWFGPYYPPVTPDRYPEGAIII